ncbi:MAG: hypothetical protein U1F10_00515 [Burkholderiales bacterium]
MSRYALGTLWSVALGVSTPCFAVSLGAHGLGQALVYPYYTVRTAPGTASPYNALLSVVNGAARGKAVKVRFREALAGAAVFETTVFLSLRDVWTAAVVPFGDGAGIITTDTSCTLPVVGAAVGGTPTANGTFSSTMYANDPLGASPGRVREGFVEVLEMGTIRQGSALELAVNHISGKPPCNLGSELTIFADLDPPSGKLYGSLTLVNVLEGTGYEYEATALDQWSAVVQYSVSGTYRPTLADASPAVSSVVAGTKLLVSTWPTGADAVNAVLAAGATQAEFMREANVNGATDIVYAMPTKPLLVTQGVALPPFYVPLSGNGACEPSGDRTLSREEQAYNPDQNQFELPAFAGLCWATTVQSLNASWPNPSAVMGSQAGMRHFVATTETFPVPTIYSAGIADQVFSGTATTPARALRPSAATTITDLLTGSQTTSTNVTYRGLPVVGVTMMRYVNGVVPVSGIPTLSNYGAGASVHTLSDVSAQ